MARYFILVLVFISATLPAQEVNWYGYLNEAWFNYINSSVRDKDSIRYFAGSVIGAGDLDPNPTNTFPLNPFSWENPFIGKLNTDYSLNWVRPIRAEAGNVLDVLATSDGGIVSLIEARNWIDLNPGDDSLIVENPHHQELSLICKWDPDGNPEWYWNIFRSNLNGSKILPNPLGGFVINGTGGPALIRIQNDKDTILLPNPGTGHLFSLHFGDDGSFIKHTTYGGSTSTGGRLFVGTNGYSTTTTSSSHYFAAGSIYDSPTLIVDGIPQIYSPTYFSSGQRSFIGKFSYNGELINFRQIEGTGHVRVTNIQADGVGGNYVIGLFTDTVVLLKGLDTIRLVSTTNTPDQADMFIGRLDEDNNWIWVRHLSGGFYLFAVEITFTTTLTEKDALLFIGSSFEDIYYDPNGINTRILQQTKGVTTFSLRVTANGEVGCAFPLILLETDWSEISCLGLDRLDTNRYFWYGIYTDSLELFDGTRIEAGSKASYMIDASFCPEYPCASVEVSACGDTLRACTWSTTSWRWYKDGQHFPDADGDSLLVITDNGAYTLVAYLNDDCPYQRPDTTRVVIDHFIRFDIDIDPVNCRRGEGGALRIIPTAGPGDYRFSLDGANYQTEPLFIGLDTGSYTVYVRSEVHGCVFTDSVSIGVLALSVVTDARCYGDTLHVGGQLFYQGEVDTLLLLESIAHPGCDSAIWVQVLFSNPVDVRSSFTYVCDSVEVGVDTFRIQFSELACDSVVLISRRDWAPSWTIDTLIWLCEGDSITINGNWYAEPGSIEVDMVSSLSCDSILRVDLRLVSIPVFDPYWDTLVAAGSTVALPAPFDMGYVFSWTPPDGLSCSVCAAPQFLAVEERSFTLHFTDAHGCFTHTVQYDIEVYAEEIALPTMFTPNGDGLNDFFGVVVQAGPPESVIVHQLTVFSRWGSVVFQGRGIDAAWDGTFKGKPSPMDTYAWILDVEYANGRREVLRGDITLVR